MKGSAVQGHYEQTFDRESAYEKLLARAGAGAPKVTGIIATPGAETSAPESAVGKIFSGAASVFKPTVGPRGGHYDSMATTVAKSAARAIGSQVGRQIVRGVLGSLFGGSSRR